MKALFLVVMLGCMIAGCFFISGCLPVMPTPDDNIHVFVFAGFHRDEVEHNIADEMGRDDSPLFNAVVLRHEITSYQHIVDLAEHNYIGAINWYVPEVAYAYHVIVDAPPTDGVLDALAEWAEEATEFEGSVVSVLANSDTLKMIQRISPLPPVVMSLKELRSREP